MSSYRFTLVSEKYGTRYPAVMRVGAPIGGVNLDGSSWELPGLPTITTLDGRSIAYLDGRRFKLTDTGEVLVPESDYRAG